MNKNLETHSLGRRPALVALASLVPLAAVVPAFAQTDSTELTFFPEIYAVRTELDVR